MMTSQEVIRAPTCLRATHRQMDGLFAMRSIIEGGQMSTEDKIRNYILDNFLFTDDQSALKNDNSFREQGILDSTGVLEVMLFLEEAFGIEVDETEMIPENLDSVNNLVAFVRRKSAR